MALDHRAGTKVIKQARREDAPGTRVDPYPYIGIVKNNLDPTRSGRLQVYIPDLGGPEEDPKTWRTVSYASPFTGYTSQKAAKPSELNRFDIVHHTYGMWMVPPDVGVQIIVIFIAGDPLRGYWIACANPHLSHTMIPALGGTTYVDPNTLGPGEKKLLQDGAAMPVAEFNEYISGEWKSSSFYRNNKPVHRVQYDILVSQGLDRDRTRGVISSSSQRESPSYVFGISTPGRPADDPAEDKNFLDNLKAGKLDPKYDFVQTRKGGHTFVMDDGALTGEDQLIRLRTAQGHQILMHDTNKTIYIGHATGKSWVEMTKDGAINVYSSSGLNFRSEGTINLRGDKNLNIDITGTIKIKAGESIRIEGSQFECLSGGQFFVTAKKEAAFNTNGFLVDSQAKISLKASQVAIEGGSTKIQSGGTVPVKPLEPLRINKLSDTVSSGAGWKTVPSNLNTIVTVAPTHEPYNRNIQEAIFTLTTPGIQPPDTYSGTDFLKNPSVSNTTVSIPAQDRDLRNQPVGDCVIGNLSKEQVTALFAQIAKTESGAEKEPYKAQNSFGYVGKYQFGAQALQTHGYIRKDLVTEYKQLGAVKHKALLANPNSWTGKNGIESLDDWFNNGPEQEAAMCEFTKRNYTTLVSTGTITRDLPPENVGGLLSVAHLLGAGGAIDFRAGKVGKDGNNTSGQTYFNNGKYAVAVLAPKLADINAG